MSEPGDEPVAEQGEPRRIVQRGLYFDELEDGAVYVHEAAEGDVLWFDGIGLTVHHEFHRGVHAADDIRPRMIERDRNDGVSR